jgi:hypothetical protein
VDEYSDYGSFEMKPRRTPAVLRDQRHRLIHTVNMPEWSRAAQDFERPFASERERCCKREVMTVIVYRHVLPLTRARKECFNRRELITFLPILLLG